MARCSLLFPFVGAATACLDETPTYTAPVQSPPIILGNQVEPATVKVQSKALTSQSTTIQLRVPFRSIDAGEDLVAIFWRDYDPLMSQEERNKLLLKSLRLSADARSVDEQDRAVTFDFEATVLAGCHTFTMHLAHESTYPIDPFKGTNVPGELPATNQFDIAQVTWFFDIQDPKVVPPRPACWSGP